MKKFLKLHFFLCLALLGMTSCGRILPERERPSAIRGTIDLRGWNFQKDGPVLLDGEWEFYHGMLYLPSDFRKTERIGGLSYITVPDLWNETKINGFLLPGTGCATYRLKIINGTDTENKILCIQRVFSSYKIWINGVLKGKGGSSDRAANIREEHIFVHNKNLIYINLEEGYNELIIQVSNSIHESGGIGKSLKLEDASAAESGSIMNFTVDLFIIGVLFFAFICNIILFLFISGDRAPLYFSLLCLTMGINTINHHFKIIPESINFTGNPYFVNYLTVILSIIAAMMTIRSLFPDEFSEAVSRIYTFFCVAFAVMLLLADFRTAESFMKVFLVSIIFFALYDIYVFSKAILNKRSGAILFTAGFAPCFLSVINDALYAMWIVNTTNTFHYSLVVLCVSTTTVISRRFSLALRTVESLSMELDLRNASLRKADRLKDRMLAGASHELRTPLHGIIGLSESMLEGAAGKLPGMVTDNLELIASSGHRLSGMVSDLLDIAKIEDEGLWLNLRPVNLRPVCEDVVRLSMPLLGSKPVVILNNISPDLPLVKADEDRLRQVLHNLVGNAVKFTGSGSITVSARAEYNEKGTAGEMPEMIEVRVSDTGIGVSAEYREEIFRAYRQLDTGDTRVYPGTGLGLAIARQIVELHGGIIRAESGPQGGSIFSFTLPVSKEQEAGDCPGIIIENIYDSLSDEKPLGQDSALDADEDAVFAGSPVFLIVDDDPVNIKVLQNYFESKNCVIKTAADGISALEIIGSGSRVDLVLLDIMMPVMSGYEVCRRIRSGHTSEELPVIMLTAKNMLADIDEAFNAGANDYIVKPFRVKELLARVGMMLKLRNIRKSASEGIAVHVKERTYPLKFSEILHITSHQKSVVIHTLNSEVEMPVLMKDIIDRLPPDIFIRIHKSHIVNINYIASLAHVVSGRYKVCLRDEEDTELPVGPSYLETIRKKIKK